MQEKFIACSFVILFAFCFSAIWAQDNQINELKAENARLSQELLLTNQIREADKEAYYAQIKIIREANERVATQRYTLGEYRDLPDDAWVRAVVGGLWFQNGYGNKNSDASSSVFRAVPGAGSAEATANGKDDAGVR